MTTLDHEPEITPDDTKPRPPVTEPAANISVPSIQPTANPVEAKLVDLDTDIPNRLSEPPIADGDTQPRTAVGGDTEEETPTDERRGCGSPLLIGAVAIVFLCMFVTIIGLAGAAGYRDGVEEKQHKQAAALQGTVGAQATLAKKDCDNKNFEVCAERCKFIATAQPFYPGITACISFAEISLSATPTPGITPTVTPQPPTATATLSSESGGFSKEELFIRGQEAIRLIDYENAAKWLEALRGLDAEYHRKDVEDMLVTAYQAMGKNYEYQLRLSEMVVVIKKAMKIRPLTGTDWDFTINAAQLYLDAKGYYDAGNYADADRVFRMLMDMAPNSFDTRTWACKTFSSAGDTAALQKPEYGCK